MGQYPSARAAAYADDGFMHDTLITVLRILAALRDSLKHAFKEDLKVKLTLPKFKVLIPGLSQEEANDAIRSVISSHAELSPLRDMVSDEALARHLVGDRPMTIQDVVKVDGLTCVGLPILNRLQDELGEGEALGSNQGFATAPTDVGSSYSLPFGPLLWHRQAGIHVSHSSSTALA